MRPTRWLWAICAAATALLASAPLAPAFVTEGPNHRPWAAVDDIARVARWDANLEALTAGGGRGLGGGLEYALDDSLCTELQFLDAPPCAEIKAVVREALDRWSAGHPALVFMDVSHAVGVQAQGDTPSHIGVGAEIDFFADRPETFAPFNQRQIAAMTNYYYDTDRRPRLTNGAPGRDALGALVAADVRFSTAACYYIDPAQMRFGCAHFPSLVQHEIAHAIGIDHPDEYSLRNLDTDDDPHNPVAINCANPADGLRVSQRIEGGAAAIGLLFGAGMWRRGPSNDDIAARDAIYPHCGVVAIDRTLPETWGAFALAEDGATMTVIGATSEEAARASINDACLQTGRNCHEVQAFTQCFAFATDGQGRSAGAVGAFIGFARQEALSRCGDSAACRVREAVCAFE